MMRDRSKLVADLLACAARNRATADHLRSYTGQCYVANFLRVAAEQEHLALVIGYRAVTNPRIDL